jgi:hypothetical protein
LSSEKEVQFVLRPDLYVALGWQTKEGNQEKLKKKEWKQKL